VPLTETGTVCVGPPTHVPACDPDSFP